MPGGFSMFKNKALPPQESGDKGTTTESVQGQGEVPREPPLAMDFDNFGTGGFNQDYGFDIGGGGDWMNDDAMEVEETKESAETIKAAHNNFLPMKEQVIAESRPTEEMEAKEADFDDSAESAQLSKAIIPPMRQSYRTDAVLPSRSIFGATSKFGVLKIGGSKLGGLPKASRPGQLLASKKNIAAIAAPKPANNSPASSTADAQAVLVTPAVLPAVTPTSIQKHVSFADDAVMHSPPAPPNSPVKLPKITDTTGWNDAPRDPAEDKEMVEAENLPAATEPGDLDDAEAEGPEKPNFEDIYQAFTLTIRESNDRSAAFKDELLGMTVSLSTAHAEMLLLHADLLDQEDEIELTRARADRLIHEMTEFLRMN